MRYIFLILTAVILILPVFFIYRYGFNPMGRDEARLVINGKEFSAEIADTLIERTRGLSGRNFLEPDKGLLFIFSQPGAHGFWMKDMKFTIDIIWISGNKIIGFEKNVAPDSYPKVFYPPAPVDRVLEFSAGTAEKFKFMAGDAVKML